MLLNNSNLLQMLDFTFDDFNMRIHQFFNYPNEDLIERKEALQNPKEFLKLLKGILQALAALEKFNVVHGNIKPEYIYFDGEKYILLDRLADNSSPNEAQIQNLKSNEFIFLPPKVFEELMKGNSFYKHNYFKTDLFCLGMVLISQLLQDEEQLQAVYDKEVPAFSAEKFKIIISHLKRNLFSEGDLKKVGDLLFYGILNPNQHQRFSPRKAIVILQNIEDSFETLNLTQEETQITQHDKETIEERLSNRHAYTGANKMVLKVNKSEKEKMVLEMEDQDNMVNETEEIELNNEK